MDIRTRYDIGCQLYMVRNDGKKVGINVVTILNIILEPTDGIKCNVLYEWNMSVFSSKLRIAEKDINRDGTVFDTREQAYQAACKLIDEDIERQLDVIRKGEKV